MSYPQEPRDRRDPTQQGGGETSALGAPPAARVPEPDADPTQPFLRDDERLTLRPEGPLRPRAGDMDALSRPQPPPSDGSDEVDEDLIRTRELPAPDDSWLQEWLGRESTPGRERMPSRPGGEASGVFPHPATTASGVPTVRHRSTAEISVVTVGYEEPTADERIARAYRDYLHLCREYRQTVVDEADFREVLQARFERLRLQYPPEEIRFRAMFDDGQVRVRVVLSRRRPTRT